MGGTTSTLERGGSRRQSKSKKQKIQLSFHSKDLNAMYKTSNLHKNDINMLLMICAANHMLFLLEELNFTPGDHNEGINMEIATLKYYQEYITNDFSTACSDIKLKTLKKIEYYVISHDIDNVKRRLEKFTTFESDPEHLKIANDIKCLFERLSQVPQSYEHEVLQKVQKEYADKFYDAQELEKLTLLETQLSKCKRNDIRKLTSLQNQVVELNFKKSQEGKHHQKELIAYVERILNDIAKKESQNAIRNLEKEIVELNTFIVSNISRFHSNEIKTIFEDIKSYIYKVKQIANVNDKELQRRRENLFKQLDNIFVILENKNKQSSRVAHKFENAQNNITTPGNNSYQNGFYNYERPDEKLQQNVMYSIKDERNTYLAHNNATLNRFPIDTHVVDPTNGLPKISDVQTKHMMLYNPYNQQYTNSVPAKRKNPVISNQEVIKNVPQLNHSSNNAEVKRQRFEIYNSKNHQLASKSSTQTLPHIHSQHTTLNTPRLNNDNGTIPSKIKNKSSINSTRNNKEIACNLPVSNLEANMKVLKQPDGAIPSKIKNQSSINPPENNEEMASNLQVPNQIPNISEANMKVLKQLDVIEKNVDELKMTMRDFKGTKLEDSYYTIDADITAYMKELDNLAGNKDDLIKNRRRKLLSRLNDMSDLFDEICANAPSVISDDERNMRLKVLSKLNRQLDGINASISNYPPDAHVNLDKNLLALFENVNDMTTDKDDVLEECKKKLIKDIQKSMYNLACIKNNK